MKTAAFATLARTLLSLIPSGAIVAEFADESRAGNLPWTRQVLFGKSSCTATESTLPYFSVTNQACRPGPVTGSSAAKTLNATVARRCQIPYESGLITYTEEFFRQS
jgi:hypothetical protein